MRRAIWPVCLIGIGLAACFGNVEPATFEFLAGGYGAFYSGQSIPAQNTCDGADISPHLSWTDVPKGGVGAFTLIVRDRDANDFVHWVLTDIPADVRELPEGRGDTIGVAGQNDFGRTGWGGPCPPSGEHSYEFKLYALTAPLQLDGAINADDVEREMTMHIIDTTSIVGVYSRSR